MKKMFTVLAMVLASLSITFMACSVSSSDDDSPVIKEVQFTDSTKEKLEALTAASSTVALDAELVYSDKTVKEIVPGVDTQVVFKVLDGDDFAEIISDDNIHKLKVKGAGTVRLQVRYGKLTANFEFTIAPVGAVNAETPVIRTGLAGGTYTEGDTATALSVEATVSDGGTLSYAWYKDDELIESETESSYVPDATTAGVFIYKVVVTNTNNNVNGKTTATAESSAKITVNSVVIKNAETPVIKTGLANKTYTVGATATALSVEATVSDDGTLSYQWYKDGTVIEDATSASYTPDTTRAGTITYKVVVTNTNNSVNGEKTATADSSATVTVRQSGTGGDSEDAEIPVIKKGLAGGTYTVGDPATALSVEATVSDGGTLSYQWYKDSTEISGATSVSYTPDTTTAGTFIYKVVVTNTNNNVSGEKTATADSSATVTVNSVVIKNAETPTIKTELSNKSCDVGETVELSVEATVSDGGTLSYAWYKDGTVISGATSASYTPDTTTAGTFTYKVVVTNTNDSVNGEKTATADSSATVTVMADAEKPEITVQPEGEECEQNAEDVLLSVSAEVSDGGVLSYQWYQVDEEGNGQPIEDATESSYAPDTAETGTFTYYVVVTNTNDKLHGKTTNTTTSNEATVTVTAGSDGSSDIGFDFN